jgi:hypothetical protein
VKYSLFDPNTNLRQGKFYLYPKNLDREKAANTNRAVNENNETELNSPSECPLWPVVLYWAFPIRNPLGPGQSRQATSRAQVAEITENASVAGIISYQLE